MADHLGKPLPTCPDNGSGALTELLAEFRRECRRNDTATKLLIFSYAVSLKGWELIRSSVERFRKQLPGRNVIAYIGLDHLLTEPEALRAMSQNGVEVYVISRWPDTFHPKVFAFLATEKTVILSGSNNLTKRGLTSNYEFALRIDMKNVKPNPFTDWLARVDRVADRLTKPLLASYSSDYLTARRLRRLSLPTTRQRLKQITGRSSPVLRRFTRAIIEVMDRETGTEGTQIQIPMEVVRTFFAMGAGDSTTIMVENDASGVRRELRLTAFGNNTARLSLFEVNRAARPCVLDLWWEGPELRFRVVSQASNRREYRRLLNAGVLQTRAGSKRFALLRS
jgi:hypothetical protein